jgi:hypothetical protein
VEGSDNCPYSGRSGYAKGTTGLMVVTTHPVSDSGEPDLSRTLSREEFRPCGRELGESVAVDLGDMPVEQGHEYATVVRNGDTQPQANYFSLNVLWTEQGLVGANSRNERSPSAADAYYGLDPRELVGYSTNQGQTWHLPGGPYGPLGGRAFIPTYIVEHTDGSKTGQPYYSSGSLQGPITMVYPSVPRRWTIRQIGAFTTGPGQSTVTLRVDGETKASAALSGTGMLREPIDPVEVEPGQTLTLTTTTGPGALALRDLYGDWTWARVMGFGTSYAHYLQSDPDRSAPLYALPHYDAVAPADVPPPADTPPPADAPPPTTGSDTPSPPTDQEATGDTPAPSPPASPDPVPGGAAALSPPLARVSVARPPSIGRVLTRGLRFEIRARSAVRVRASLLLDHARGGAGARLLPRGRTGDVEVGRALAKVGSGSVRRLTVRPRSSARRALRGVRAARMTLRVIVIDGDGDRNVFQRRVSLRAGR